VPKAYDLLAVPALKTLARIGSLFNDKLKRGIDGRRSLMIEIEEHYKSVTDRRRILIHVSSFGELEQAKPIVEQLAQQTPRPHIHLTFFSPSGYENAKARYSTPDLITYAPFDDQGSVKQFLERVRPDLALFVRYDVWPNMAKQLRALGIPSILFSATFDARRESPMVRKLHRNTYDQLSKILTISTEDKLGFERLGVVVPINVAGDTRFDQVAVRKSEIANADTHVLPDNVRNNLRESKRFVLVAGSTWAKDEELISEIMLRSPPRFDDVVLIIAPHEPSEGHVQKLLDTFGAEAIKLSECDRYAGERVIIVDSIGKLFSLYQEADIAYVGGGFSDGVHNVLEPSVWRKPVIVGPRHERSQEVAALIGESGGIAVTNDDELGMAIARFKTDRAYLSLFANNAEQFVKRRLGATTQIMCAIEETVVSDHDLS